MLSNELLRLYRRFRSQNATYWCGSYRHHSMFNRDIADANRCLDNARTILAFRDLEFDNLDEDSVPDTDDYENGDTIGLVRLRVEPDECFDWRDELECFIGDATTEEQREHRRKEFERIAADGAWGTIGEVWNGNSWEECASCWGHVGYDNPADPLENCYALDAMRACIDRSRELTAEREAAIAAWTIA